MKSTLARVSALLAFGSLFFLVDVHAQSMEIYAGGGKIRDTPGANAPVVPQLIAIAPDGMVYVTESSTRTLLKFDPATGLATRLPGTEPEFPGQPPPQDFLLDTKVLAFNPAGELLGSTDEQLFRFNLQDGTREFLPGSGWGGGADFQVAFDANGALYYYKQNHAMYSNSNLLVRDSWGYTELLKQVGDGGFGGDGGPLETASFTHPRGLARDAQGNLYISDQANSRVRKIAAIDGVITPQSVITTVAGNGDWYSPDENVPATQTGLGFPGALAVDSLGNLYVHEQGGNRVRRISAGDGLISTYVGNGEWGTVGDGGPATAASIDLIQGNMVFDSADNLYLADMGQMRVRRVDAATGIITTVLGNGTFSFCTDVAPRREACLANPQGMAFDTNGNVYLSDSGNLRIRRIDAATGELRTIAGASFDYVQSGDGGPAISANFGAGPGGLAFDPAGNLLIAGTWAHNIRRIESASGIITTIAGTGTSGFSGDGGPATAARFNNVSHVLADAAGNVYLSDTGNYRIRKISPGGLVSTIAGNGTRGFNGDGGAATAAMLQRPGELALDATGNLYFKDDYRIRRIAAGTGIISTIAGNGNYQVSGNGGPATAAGLGFFSFNFDAAGNILVMSFSQLRRIDVTTGLINAYGSQYGIYTPEGIGAQSPSALLVRPDGRIFVVDGERSLLFRIEPPEPTVPDTTPPVITPMINGTPGVDDWYRSNISVDWHVADAESPVSSRTGCSATSVTADTAGVTFTCSAASAGGTASRSVTVRRDTVAPTLTLDGFAPAVDEFGWRTHPASAWFWAWDGFSGIQSTSPNPTMINQEGAGVSVQITATDKAGNTTTISTPPINQDFYPPVIASDRASPTGSNGWYRQDVRLNWQVIEDISPIRSKSGCDDPLLGYDTPGVTFICSASSGGGAASSSITLKRDATPPTLTFSEPSPAPNAAGWHTGDVTFTFTTADATSGVATTSRSSPVVITGDGMGLTAQVTVTDAAGNTATFTTPPVNIDRNPPTVTPAVSGASGNNGWYVGNVLVSWNVTGNVASSTGCDTSTVDTDSAGVTFTCSVTSPSGNVSESITVRRDATPPTLTFGPPSPAPNAQGWHMGDVSLDYTAADSGSGVASAGSGGVVITGEGAGLTASVTVSDVAGNSAVFASPPVNIQRIPPAIAPLITGAFGNEGWYRSDVQVSWVITGNITSSNGCADSTVNEDTSGLTFTCSVTSPVGNAINSVTIKRDTTPPVLTWRTPSPTPNAAGWIRTNATFPFNAPTDALSGIASVSQASPLLVTAEGSNVTGTVTVTDRAGNVAQFTSAARNIDKTSPTIDLRTPAEGALFGYYATVYADYDCADGVSAITTCTGNVADGVALNTRTVNGAYSFKVTAKDVAGNTGTSTHAWSVSGGLDFQGFLAPASAPPTLNLVTRGSLVPVRWQLPDGNGGFVSNTASFTSATVSTVSCGSAAVVPLNDTASGASGIGFDSGTSTYTYNWQTNAGWTGCRKLTIKLRDNSLHELLFRFQ